DQGAALKMARSVYNASDVRLDPFSPGLHVFTRIPVRELPTLAKRAMELLGMLEHVDVAWKDFYAARRRAFEARPQRASDLLKAGTATSSPTEALENARQALKAGDMQRLAALADVLTAVGTPGGRSSSHAADGGIGPTEDERGPELPPDAYSSETLTRSR